MASPEKEPNPIELDHAMGIRRRIDLEIRQNFLRDPPRTKFESGHRLAVEDEALASRLQ